MTPASTGTSSTSAAISRSPIGSCFRAGDFGLSNGDLPLERQFSLGGIGTIHGYAFKEVSGTGMALMNGEYRVRLVRGSRGDHDMLAVFGFYDAGRISGPIDGSAPIG